MSLRKTHILAVGVLAVLCWVFVFQPGALAADELEATHDSVTLLQPFDGTDEINIEPGLGTWTAYFDTAWSWMVNIAVGFCVLWTLMGGIKVTAAGDDSGERSKGFDMMKSAIAALAVLVFAGAILRYLNNVFFT